jgi:exodeoxyribonuclease V
MDGDFRKIEIEWSEQQLDALELIVDWYERDEQQVFYLSGYAGTGKTTLAREVGRRVDDKVIYTSYTGRACAVLARKDCAPVDTVDKLVYRRRRFEHCAKDPGCATVCVDRCPFKREGYGEKSLDPESPVASAALVIADEVSMLGRDMARDLLSFGRKTLVLGDIGQLPAIFDTAYFKDREPDFHLSQIHRQEAGSPIVNLATRARRAARLPVRQFGDSAVVYDIANDDLTAFTQIVTGTHRQRRYINRLVRRQLGFGGKYPEPGEKLVCLKNHRKLELRNGELWWVVEARPDRHGFVEMTVRDETGQHVDVAAPLAGFNGDGNGGDLPEQPFDFGYAITCHKSQGSEWDSVLVFDEGEVFGADAARWRYTAITRAARRVTVVVPR